MTIFVGLSLYFLGMGSACVFDLLAGINFVSYGLVYTHSTFVMFHLSYVLALVGSSVMLIGTLSENSKAEYTQLSPVAYSLHEVAFMYARANLLNLVYVYAILTALTLIAIFLLYTNYWWFSLFLPIVHLIILVVSVWIKAVNRELS